jgi:CRISPR-associated protein Cmr6
MSSIQPLTLEEWEDIKGLLRRALRQGLGGKTSTGYGLWANPKDKYALSVYLKGVGVSSLLRSDEPEFRPNLFKATLKGHVSRLLAGVCSDEASIHKKVNKLFGHTATPGNTQIYWESKLLERDIQGIEETPIYRTRGTLHIDAPQAELEFLRSVVKFAYVMGGFGKSWRRVWHQGDAQWHSGFCSSYKTRAIGCHWESLDTDWVNILTQEDLANFLIHLPRQCETYLSSSPQPSMAWREAWHPKRVAVYSSSKLVKQSLAVELFHQEIFKTTPAIGGRNPGDDRPKFVSSVWHRMLPVSKDQLGEDQYLEIVTVFHGTYDRHQNPWHREGEDQLPLFIQALEDKKLKLTWGKPT